MDQSPEERLPHRARLRAHAHDGARKLRLHPPPPQHADHRALRRRQVLARLRPRRAGLPGGLLRRLSSHAPPARRPRARPRRRPRRPVAQHTRPGRPRSSGKLSTGQYSDPPHSSTTGAPSSSMPGNAAISSRSSRTATVAAPPSSPARPRSRPGTTSSATPPSPMRCSPFRGLARHHWGHGPPPPCKTPTA